MKNAPLLMASAARQGGAALAPAPLYFLADCALDGVAAAWHRGGDGGGR